MPVKIKIQKYYKISKGTKNVRIPHVLYTLPILHFFELFKTFWDFIWLEYFLNRLFTLRKCSNDSWKNQNPKIVKNYQGYEECEEFFVPSPILHFFELFKKIWDFIWLGYCLNRFITLRGCSNGSQKNQNPQIQKNYQPHILRTIPIFHFFELFKIFWNFIWLGYYLYKFITLKGCSNVARKNQNPKILNNY